MFMEGIGFKRPLQPLCDSPSVSNRLSTGVADGPDLASQIGAARIRMRPKLAPKLTVPTNITLLRLQGIEAEQQSLPHSSTIADKFMTSALNRALQWSC